MGDRRGPQAGAGRIAFVAPRFGAAVVGGSEAVSREAAMGFAGRGWEVEVLTTCAVDHFTWHNVLPEGAAEEDGVLVRRFPAVRDHSRVARRAQDLIEAGGVPTPDAQIGWLGFHFRSPALFHHLLAHGEGFDAVVFSPYLFWTTLAGVRAVPERAVVMPCLHDEGYARLEVVRHALAGPASVWFLSEPEHELAHRLGPVTEHHTVTGAGVDVPATYDPEGFRARHGIRRPFVLYAGRRESGKGWDWLVDAFTAAVTERGVDLDLVTIGVGEIDPPPAVADRVVDLGFVSPAERDDAFAAAAAYVQPSLMESFSRSIMESWLAGTPVLARAQSEVVAWHCTRSGGGILFSDRDELAGALEAIARSPADARAMAAKGRAYVEREYSWDAVLARMEADVIALCERRGADAPRRER
jgi:glycosyltransferase involved in cell wall biosynthesis